MWAQHLCSSGAVYDDDEEWEREGGRDPQQQLAVPQGNLHKEKCVCCNLKSSIIK